MFAHALSAQVPVITLSGRVVDEKGNPVGFVGVTVKGNDNKVQGTSGNADGTFSINLSEGEYDFEVSLLGYKKHSSRINISTDMNLGTIVLKTDARMIKGAKVTANTVEYNMNGYVYQIADIKEFGNKNLTDILMTAPGLMVMPNRFTLYGSSVGNVFLNNRRINLRNDSLVNFLSAFRGEQIERIEVITDPDISERYPGTSVRIITKNLDGGVGSVGARTNGGVGKFVVQLDGNVNYFKERWSLYASGTYMFMSKISDDSIRSERKDGYLVPNENRHESIKIPFSMRGQIGIGYDLTKQDFFSMEISFNSLRRDIVRNRISSISEVVGDYGFMSHRPSVSMMYEHMFKDKSKLTVAGDYMGSYRTSSTRDSIPEKFGLSVTELNAVNNSNTFAAYARYAKVFKKKHSLNAGVRFTGIVNEAVNGEKHFPYRENVLRPFASYSYGMEKFGISAGFQGHFSFSNGNFQADAVPNMGASYYINRKKGHVLRVNWSLGISRPSMKQLNPAAVLSETESFVNVGNPELKPFFGNSVGANLTISNRYKLSASYYRADKAITSYMYHGEDDVTYRTYINGKLVERVSVAANVNLLLFKRLSLDMNLNYGYNSSIIDDTRRFYHTLSASLMSHVFLPQSWGISLMADVGTPKVISYNTTQRNPLYLLLTIHKKLGNWNLQLQVSDPLNSERRRLTVTDFGDYTQIIGRETNSVGVQVKASYNFTWGKLKKQKGRKIESGKQELTERIGAD